MLVPEFRIVDKGIWENAPKHERSNIIYDMV